MPDLASLSFDIDSSQAQRAIAVLESLKASSISVTQSNQQLNQSASNLSQVYDQQRDALTKLVTQTKAYDGTLQGLITRLNQTRDSMRTSQQAVSAYASTLVAATSAATSFNSTVEGLDRYVATAKQLNIQTKDLATSFERITAALKNQTVEGNQTRQMLTQLGVSLNGVSSNRPDVILQRVADTMRQYRQTQFTTQAFQQLGFGDAQQQTALAAQPYIPFTQQQQADRQNQARTQIDSQQAQIQLITARLARNAAQLADDASRFTLNPSVLGRLGLSSGGTFMPADQQRAEYERIRGLSPAEQQPYQRYSYQLSQGLQNSAVGNAVRNVTSGTWSSNQDEIYTRMQLDRAASGFVSAIATAWGHELQNAVGLYKPTLLQDNRDLSPAERLYQRQQSAGVFASLGDTALQGIVNAQTQYSNFTTDPTIAQRYTQAFGADGTRRRINQQAQLQQNLIYAQQPEQAGLDAANREALIAALPVDQRARARAGIQFLGQTAGTAATVLPAGAPLSAITRNVNLSRGQQQTGEQTFQTNLATQLGLQSDDTRQQITFQTQLADAVSKGRAAAEDFTRTWNARNDVMRQGGSLAQQEKAATEAQALTDAQRVTQGASAIDQLQRENADRREQLELTKQLNAENATTEERAQRMRDLVVHQQVSGEVASGSLSPTQTAARRQALLAQSPAQTAQAAAAGAVQTQIQDNERLVQIMQSQHETLEQASRELQAQKTLEAAITEAKTQGNEALVKQLESERNITSEQQRQLNLSQQAAANTNANNQGQLDNAFERYVGGLPADQRPYARANKQSWIANQQAGQGGMGPPAPVTAPTTPWIQQPAAQPYMGLLQRSAANNNLPLGLLTELIGQESSFQNGVTNRMGPGGTPISTATGLGQQIAGNRYLHGGDPRDAATSIEAAAEEFAARLRQAGGNIAMAATGYGVAGRNLPPQRRQAVIGALNASMTPQEAALYDTTNQGVRIGQENQDISQQEAFQQSQGVQAQRTALLRRGLTGAASTLVAPDLNLPPDLAAAGARRQQLGIIGGQIEQAAGQEGQTNISIANLNRMADAFRDGQAAATALTARIQAENEARAVAPGVINAEIRAQQLLTEQLAKTREAAAQEILARGNSMDVQRAQNAMGPFASQQDLSNAAADEQLRQRFRDNPGLEQSPEGQGLVQQNEAAKTLAQQTQQMEGLRDAAKQTEDAFMQTFEAVVVHGARGTEVIRNLGQELETIILRNVVEKPFEKLVNSALTSLWGGDSGSPGGGTGGGSPGGGSPGDGSMVGLGGQVLRSFTGGSSSGGGGGGSGGGDSGTRGGSFGNGGGGSSGGGGRGPAAGASSGGSVLSSVFGHAGGATGWLVDQIGGEGFYKGGGLIGQAYNQYQAGQSLQAPGDTTPGGTGGSGGPEDTGYITPPIPPDATAGIGDAAGSGIGDAAGAASDFGDLSSVMGDVAFAAAKGLVFPNRGRWGTPNTSLADYENQVIEAPTLFRFARGAMGMMGEAGPEAVMPLRRGADGRLGVSAGGAPAQGAAPTINFNIHTPNADSFRASQSQIHSRAASQLNHSMARTS